MDFCDLLEKGVIFLYNGIVKDVRERFDVLLEETDVDDVILERETRYARS